MRKCNEKLIIQYYFFTANKHTFRLQSTPVIIKENYRSIPLTKKLESYIEGNHIIILEAKISKKAEEFFVFSAT